MKNRKKFYLALVVFSLIGQVAWVVENMYFNVFIYKMFNASATDISLMVQASAVVATFTTIFIGALSDRVGKRKLFMCLGYIAWGVSILAFALVRLDVISGVLGTTVGAASAAVAIVIVLDCVMTFFGSSANDAAYNAWLTDQTDETNRGKAEGINSMMPLIAILVVFGGFMGFDLNRAESWTAIYLIIGAVVLLIGVLGFFIVEDAAVKKADDLGYFATILYGFRPSIIRKNKKLYWTLAGFIVFGIAIQIYMPYLIIYYEQSLGMSDYVLIMAPAILAAAVVTAFYGRLIDRIGFRKAVYPSLGMLALGFAMLFLFPGIVPVEGFGMKALVFIGSLLMMSGYLSGMAVFGAEIRNETPEHMAGRFQGLRILAQVLVPGVIGPAIGAAVLKNAEVIVNSDGTTSFLPNEWIFFAALVVIVILAAGLTLLFMLSKQKRIEEK
ncbi:MAG: MFS transporter [Lachnospiraceae bacterium]|nr:MFS transporter [Lachnospiraceae bacterium]